MGHTARQKRILISDNYGCWRISTNSIILLFTKNLMQQTSTSYAHSDIASMDHALELLALLASWTPGLPQHTPPITVPTSINGNRIFPVVLAKILGSFWYFFPLNIPFPIHSKPCQLYLQDISRISSLFSTSIAHILDQPLALNCLPPLPPSLVLTHSQSNLFKV